MHPHTSHFTLHTHTQADDDAEDDEYGGPARSVRSFAPSRRTSFSARGGTGGSGGGGGAGEAEHHAHAPEEFGPEAAAAVVGAVRGLSKNWLSLLCKVRAACACAWLPAAPVCALHATCLKKSNHGCFLLPSSAWAVCATEGKRACYPASTPRTGVQL